MSKLIFKAKSLLKQFLIFVLCIFTGDSYSKIDDFGIVPGYPRLITTQWPAVPSNLDAVLHWQDLDQTYFFKVLQFYSVISRKNDAE